MTHKVYKAIIQAMRNGTLVEPFSWADFLAACPGLGCGTYTTFLHKHARGNPGGNTELFQTGCTWPVQMPSAISIRAIGRSG